MKIGPLMALPGLAWLGMAMFSLASLVRRH
jgi:hypothetical protein